MKTFQRNYFKNTHCQAKRKFKQQPPLLQNNSDHKLQEKVHAQVSYTPSLNSDT